MIICTWISEDVLPSCRCIDYLTNTILMPGDVDTCYEFNANDQAGKPLIIFPFSIQPTVFDSSLGKITTYTPFLQFKVGPEGRIKIRID